LLIPLALGIGFLLARVSVSAGRRVGRRMHATLDDRLVRHMRAPLLAVWTVVAYRALVEFIGLSIGTTKFVDLVARAFAVAFATWVAIRATYVAEKELPGSHWAGEKPEMRSLLPLLGRVLRIVLLAIGAIVLVAQFGYSVATLITGLGIGGIAVALAMQKTLEHMFGSIAISIDQPIRVGDWVKVGETEGEVEAIGLRSTRLRTLERSLVVIPNGRLSEMQMENFGVRDRVLLRTNMALAYGTRVDQVQRIRDEVDTLLRDHPLVWPGNIIVRFKGLGPVALDIEVICWMATKDFNVFRAAREEIFFRMMKIVEQAGSDFAYPLDKRHL
jgi:MscS family membrane protein